MRTAPRERARNPRGAGGQLRSEIVQAARDLLIETGTETAVTLRAVARRVGITAPSIYAHFDDAQQIVQAVIGETFTALNSRLEQARAGTDDPRARLVADCRAYLAFGAEHPALYGLLFSHPRPHRGTPVELSEDELVADVVAAIGNGRPGDLVGGEGFALILRDVLDAVAAGVSTAEDPLRTATQLWVAMHGLVLLRASATHFPWRDPEALELDLIHHLARFTATGPGPTPSG